MSLSTDSVDKSVNNSALKWKNPNVLTLFSNRSIYSQIKYTYIYHILADKIISLIYINDYKYMIIEILTQLSNAVDKWAIIVLFYLNILFVYVYLMMYSYNIR